MRKKEKPPFSPAPSLMLHTPMLTAGEHVHRHVLSVKSAAEPEPNRQLRSGNQASPKAKSPSTSPLSSKTSTSSRVSTQQHGRASRFLNRFMNSILIRLLPVGALSVDLSASAPSFPSPVCTSTPNNLSMINVVDSLKEILEADKRHRIAASEETHGLGIPSHPDAATEQSRHPRDFSDAICMEDSQLPTEGSAAAHWSPESSDDESATPNCILGLPTEIIFKIFGFVDEKDNLLALSRVSKDIRSYALSDSFWKTDLARLVQECNIQQEYIQRSNDRPSYLRWCAINRWVDTYKEAKTLLELFNSENRTVAEERERFETLASKMMPGISPWAQPQDYLEEIEMTLPKTIEVLQRKELDSIHVVIELTHGVFKYELMLQGKPPILEFLIYNPTRRRPTVICQTADIYHPYLSSTTKNLDLPSNSLCPTEDSVVTRDASQSLQQLILAINDAFTNMNSLASDFTL